ncbi:hypothetical protein [Sphingomonas paeninsulae]|uniref:hypothetical protein n=1 Tax=Sphingomonas paeninsulae TaxID=2319844 RepID=UPI0013CEF87F|nr:hypothetical protein [Sphingomonas paeninsulae]
MRALNPPAIDYRALYRKAISQTQRNADRAVLAGIEDRMMGAGVDYDATMQAEGPHAVVQIALTAAEESLAGALYEKRIVATNGICRSTYDDLRVSTSSCPFCLDGEIYEIDHFLPQAHHHDVVVYPGNLVPICHPCNHIKLELLPADARHSLLHPYFDRLPEPRSHRGCRECRLLGLPEHQCCLPSSSTNLSVEVRHSLLFAAVRAAEMRNVPFAHIGKITLRCWLPTVAANDSRAHICATSSIQNSTASAGN